MAESNHTSRSLWFQAATQIRNAGYDSIRVSGQTRPFDLIAWNAEQVFFLVVRRTRTKGISSFTDDICRLGTRVRSGVPGQVHFWLYRSGNWLRYRIMPGGAMPVQQGSLWD